MALPAVAAVPVCVNVTNTRASVASGPSAAPVGLIALVMATAVSSTSAPATMLL
jgi:hypothetical protein